MATKGGDPAVTLGIKDGGLKSPKLERDPEKSSEHKRKQARARSEKPGGKGSKKGKKRYNFRGRGGGTM